MAETTDSGTAGTARPALVLVAVVIGSALMGIDMIITSVALPRIGAELAGASLVSLQWLVVGYSLAFGALVQPAGALADRWGSRTMFLTGIGAFTVSSLLCGSAWSVLSLDAFRVVQGASAAVMFANVMPLLMRSFDERRRPMAIAVWTAVLTTTVTLSPLLGGALVALGGWRWMFLINVPLGLVAFVVAYAVVEPDRPGTVTGRFDRLGAVTVALVLVALNMSLSLAQQDGFGDPLVLAGLAATGLLAAGYVAHHRRVSDPVLDLGLLRSRSFLGVSLLAVLNRVATVGGAVFFILYVQSGHGLSPLATGLLLVPLGVATAGGSLLAGRLQSWVAAKWVLVAGFSGLALGGAGIALTVAPGGDPIVAIPALTLWGLGNGLANPPLMAVASQSVPRHRVGMATGMVNSSFPVGASLGTVLLGLVFTGVVGPLDTTRTGQVALLAAGTAATFWWITAVMVVAVAAAATLVAARPGAPVGEVGAREPDPAAS